MDLKTALEALNWLIANELLTVNVENASEYVVCCNVASANENGPAVDLWLEDNLEEIKGHFDQADETKPDWHASRAFDILGALLREKMEVEGPVRHEVEMAYKHIKAALGGESA